MGITKKVLSSGLAACMLFGFGGSVLFPQQTLSYVEARRHPGQGSYWNGDSNYYCVWSGGHVSWYADLSSRVWNKDGSAAVLVDLIDNEYNTLFKQQTYKFYSDGTYQVDTGKICSFSQSTDLDQAVYDTLNR